MESGHRLYDDPALSAKFVSSLMTGADVSSWVDKVNPLIKAIGSLKGDKSILNAEGKVVGDMDQGIPGFMPHIQDTPFFGLYMSMTEATHHYPTVPQIYSQKREIVYPRGNILGMLPIYTTIEVVVNHYCFRRIKWCKHHGLLQRISS